MKDAMVTLSPLRMNMTPGPAWRVRDAGFDPSHCSSYVYTDSFVYCFVSLMTLVYFFPSLMTRCSARSISSVMKCSNTACTTHGQDVQRRDSLLGSPSWTFQYK